MTVDMDACALAEAFFRSLDEKIGPFDRPFHFRVFPFEAGGALDFLTIGAGRGEFVTYLTWGLLGNPEQKHGALGPYEIVVACNDEHWCLEVLTNIGRQGLQEVFEGGDTLDIGAWVGAAAPLQGVIFEEALFVELRDLPIPQTCRLLRCIGVTRREMEFAIRRGTESLIQRLRASGLYPMTNPKRGSLDLIL
jgi:hypothetical protein